MELLERGATLKQTVKKLKRIKKVWTNNKMNEVLLHASARLHTIVGTREAVTTMVCTHHPYSLHLTPSNFHLFGP